MGVVSELLLYFLGESVADTLRWAARRVWIHYAVDDRFEERINDVPTRQCRIVAVDNDHDTKLITVEWDDGSRTSGNPEVVLHAAHRIHPLAPRLPRV